MTTEESIKMTVREICQVIVVEATPEQVWEAWTTEQGVRTFFAPRARIVMEVGGPYELFFDPEAEAGSRGSEGCTITELEEPRYFNATWNFPPSLPSIRNETTTLGVGLQSVEGGMTRVVLTQTGWRAGKDWDEGYRYFQRAWRLVLARLRHRFEKGPIDWSKPYTPAKL